jgi:hypothetical protein
MAIQYRSGYHQDISFEPLNKKQDIHAAVVLKARVAASSEITHWSSLYLHIISIKFYLQQQCQLLHKFLAKSSMGIYITT